MLEAGEMMRFHEYCPVATAYRHCLVGKAIRHKGFQKVIRFNYHCPRSHDSAGPSV